jgi:hypothetical protein
MHYQVVVLSSEIGDAMEIESISFNRFPSPDDRANFNDMVIHMGLCDSDELTAVFADNYVSGTKTEVMSASSYMTESVAVGEWYTFDLDTPYWYNGQDNLLIEVEWSSGSGSLYSWSWDTGSDRKIYGDYGSTSAPSQNIGGNVPTMQLDGTLSLDQSTFGRIKSVFI